MNRAIVEKAIERVMDALYPEGGTIAAFDYSNRVAAVNELSALTDLLSHYPKEEEVRVYFGNHTGENGYTCVSCDRVFYRLKESSYEISSYNDYAANLIRRNQGKSRVKSNWRM